jgi:hypothetical protein
MTFPLPEPEAQFNDFIVFTAALISLEFILGENNLIILCHLICLF